MRASWFVGDCSYSRGGKLEDIRVEAIRMYVHRLSLQISVSDEKKSSEVLPR